MSPDLFTLLPLAVIMLSPHGAGELLSFGVPSLQKVGKMTDAMLQGIEDRDSIISGPLAS